MRIFKDWDCRLLPMMGELITDPKDTVKTMLLLEERFGFRRFMLMPCFDPNVESISIFLLRRERAFEELKQLIPKELSVACGAVSVLSEGFSQLLCLKKLRIPRTNFLPIRLPLFSDRDMISRELNQLLYHSPHRVLFHSFDSLLPYYPFDDLLRWSKLRAAAYGFRFQALESPALREIMRSLIQRNAPVLLGSGINAYGKACYYEFDRYFALASEYFSSYERDYLFFNNRIYKKL